MGDRGRFRSSAQKAGTSNAYMSSNRDVMPNYTQNVNTQRQIYGPPQKSDVNLLLDSEDNTRAGYMYLANNAYSWRLNPITYIESQMSQNF